MKKIFLLLAFITCCFAGIAQEASSSKKQAPVAPPQATPVVETKENTQGAVSGKKNAPAPAATPVKEENASGTTAPATSGKRKPD